MKKLEKMSLENVKNKLTKSEMNSIMAGSGRNTVTSAGTQCGPHGQQGKYMKYDYGYDVYRYDRPDINYITYHDRSNVRNECEQNRSH